MSGEISFSWLNKILRNSGQEGITSSEYARIYDELKNGDDVSSFDSEEFKEALSTVLDDDQMAAIEEGYNDAFAALAAYDGEDGISLQDLDDQSAQEGSIADTAAQEAADKISTAASDKNFANSEDYQNRENKRPVALQGQTASVESVSANSLSGQNVETLRAERAQISTDIENKRTEMEEAKRENQGAVETAEGAYNTALQELAKEIGEIDESSSDAEKNYVDLKNQRDEKKTQVDDQVDVIEELKQGVDSQKTAVSSLDNQLANHLATEPQQASYKKEVTKEDGTIEEVDDTEAYNTAHEAWEQQKTELENNKKEAEDKLSEYEQQLGEAEDALKVLEQELQELDGQVQTAADELTELKNEDGESLSAIVDSAKADLDTARTALQEATQSYEADIAQLQLNLAEYDTAITQAENSLNLEENEGVEKKGSFKNESLDAVNSSNDQGILSRNAEILDSEEQEEYLNEYLGEGNYGEAMTSTDGSTYYSKTNDDGTTDCFKVVNDQGEIRLIHTNIPADDSPTTEVYGVEALMDSEGNPRTYSKYVTTSAGTLQPGQIEALANEMKESGVIPEDVDLISLHDSTLSSLIEEYADGTEFVETFISPMEEEEIEDLYTRINAYVTGNMSPNSMAWLNSHGETIQAQTALQNLVDPEDNDPGDEGDASIESIKENGDSAAAGYLERIESSIRDYTGDGVSLSDEFFFYEYDALAKEILEKLTNDLDQYVDYRSVFKTNLNELFTEEDLPERYDLICLDYIQNTPLKGSTDDYNRLTDLTQYIKAFTLTGLDKTGVICSQVAKSQFNDKGGVDKDITLLPKGSNAIFEASDYVVQLLRDPETLLVYVSNTKNKDLQLDPKRVYKINPDLRFTEVK